MAKKKSAKGASAATGQGTSNGAKKKVVKKPTPEKAAVEQVESQPRVRRAAEAVDRAKAELEKAQQLYQKVRKEATDRLKNVREKKVGELIDGTIDATKKHPGLGLFVAATAGFFLGRIFRR